MFETNSGALGANTDSRPEFSQRQVGAGIYNKVSATTRLMSASIGLVVPPIAERLHRALKFVSVAFALLVVFVDCTQADNGESLYFDPEISLPARTPGCVELQAKIKATRMRDPDPALLDHDSRFAEILKRLPDAQAAAQTITRSLQQRMGIPLANLADRGLLTGASCLKSLDLANQTLIVITISVSDHYACNQSSVPGRKPVQACSLPTTVTYAVCRNLTCRAEQRGWVGIDVNTDTFDRSTTNLEGLVDRTLQNALSLSLRFAN